MTDATAPMLGRLSHPALATLMWLAVALLPVTGLPGLGALGELKGSASTYVLLLAIPVALATVPLAQIAVPRPLLVFLTCLMAWLAVTTAVNYDAIAVSWHHGRSGLSKLIASSIVLGFGLAVTALSLAVFRSAEDVERLFARPLCVAVLACAVFAVPELWSWVSPTGEAVYRLTTGLLHTGDETHWRVAGRLVSLAFEAPDLSYFCGFACPWLLLAWRLSARNQIDRRGPLFAVLPLLLCIVIMALSASRTGVLMLAGLIGVELVYWIGLRRWRLPPLPVAGAIAVVLTIAITLWLTRDFHRLTADSADVSTVSRLALLLAQLAVFAENPVFGVGFGQFGFHVVPHLPSWAWESFEIRDWFEKIGELPPSFNVAARVGAELGAPGLVIWYGFWLWAMWRIARAAPHQRPGSMSLYLDVALLANAACLMLGGISSDAFRRPETWIVIAITALHAGRTDASPARDS
jgi:O-antigen ligase